MDLSLGGRGDGAQSARVYFQEALASALSRQRVPVAGETEVYLVELLVSFLSSQALFVADGDGRTNAEPLAFILKRAVDATPAERARHLKRLGDTALYVSGFFSDSLAKGPVDIDYYAAMGGQAYDALGAGGVGVPDVFRELAGKFRRLVDVIAEISERSSLTSDKGLVRLYERYLATGSERLRLMLEGRGLGVVAGGRRRH